MPVREGRSAVLGRELRIETASPRSAAPAHTDHKFRTASLGAWPRFMALPFAVSSKDTKDCGVGYKLPGLENPQNVR